MSGPAQHEAAYKVGLEHSDQKYGITEALRRLESTGINRGSAQFLVYGLGHMLRGECYTRAISVPVTDDFLTWIRRDRGRVALGNALEALGRHIEYYEKKYRTRRPTLRDLLTKHSEFLTESPTASILMEWKDRVSSGFIDVLPLAWFEEEGFFAGMVHEVQEPDGSKCYAKCDVTVRAMSADLDFSAYSGFNQSQELLLGVARIEFDDIDRTSIGAVSWKSLGSEQFVPCPYEIRGFQTTGGTDYQPPQEPSGKSARMVRDRPGQPKFRSDLRSVYNNCCCVTACSIPAVLECAHIDPYLAPGSDNTRNGLLLRGDIHALFDRHLISIEPSTHVIHVSPRAFGEGGYAELHGMALRLPKDDTHHPDRSALERHWKRFLQNHTFL